MAQGVLKVDNLSFDLKGGEILGIAGVEGNGQSELIDTLTGLNKNYSGEVKIKGEDITKDSIEDIRELKLAHIPEDRMTSGMRRKPEHHGKIYFPTSIRIRNSPEDFC